MLFSKYKSLTGIAVIWITSLGILQPGFALPLNPQAPGSTVSQINRPPEEGTPRVLTEVVRGTVTRVGGNSVTIEMENGETETFKIPAEFENRRGLEVGSEVLLTIERGNVVAIYNRAVVVEQAPVVRREVQRQEVVRPAPAPAPAPVPPPAPRPAPAPAAQPAPQPVRGMW